MVRRKLGDSIPLFVTGALRQRWLLLRVQTLDLGSLDQSWLFASGGLKRLGLSLDTEVEVANGREGAIEGSGVGGDIVRRRVRMVDGGHGCV